MLFQVYAPMQMNRAQQEDIVQALDAIGIYPRYPREWMRASGEEFGTTLDQVIAQYCATAYAFLHCHSEMYRSSPRSEAERGAPLGAPAWPAGHEAARIVAWPLAGMLEGGREMEGQILCLARTSPSDADEWLIQSFVFSDDEQAEAVRAALERHTNVCWLTRAVFAKDLAAGLESQMQARV